MLFQAPENAFGYPWVVHVSSESVYSGTDQKPEPCNSKQTDGFPISQDPKRRPSKAKCIFQAPKNAFGKGLHLLLSCGRKMC